MKQFGCVVPHPMEMLLLHMTVLHPLGKQNFRMCRQTLVVVLYSVILAYTSQRCGVEEIRTRFWVWRGAFNLMVDGRIFSSTETWKFSAASAAAKHAHKQPEVHIFTMT